MHANAAIAAAPTPNASFASSPLVSAYRSAVGEATVAGDLPTGIEIDAWLDEFGLLRSFIVRVTECAAVVIDAHAVLAAKKGVPLNRTGATIQKILSGLAVHLPEKLHCGDLLLQAADPTGGVGALAAARHQPGTEVAAGLCAETRQ